jgi:hypothetical protein
VNPTERTALIDRYRTGTADVEAALAGITDEELDRPPSDPHAWTARQVAHHLADSEAMAYIRLRRLIAEDAPVIAGYDEPEWAAAPALRPPDRRLDRRPRGRPLLERGAPGTADGRRMDAGRHTQHSGPYAVDDWLRIYAGHSHDHADQIRAARAG